MANSTNTSQQAGALFREKPLDGSLEILDFGQAFNSLPKPINLGDISTGLKDLVGEIAGTQKTSIESQPSMLPGEKRPFPTTGSLEGFQRPRMNPEIVTANIERFKAEEQRASQSSALHTQKEEIRLDVVGTPIEDRNKALNISGSFTGKLSYNNMVNFRAAKMKQQPKQPSMLKGGEGKSPVKGPGKGAKFDAEGGGLTSSKSRVG